MLAGEKEFKATKNKLAKIVKTMLYCRLEREKRETGKNAKRAAKINFAKCENKRKTLLQCRLDCSETGQNRKSLIF